MNKYAGPKISATVFIYNEDWQIRDCLETIKWVDEIVICDSFSTDRTIEICREYTDKIYQRKFDNFGNQKNWTLDKPSHDWVLYVEADERFTPQLRDEIREKLAKNEGFDGYRMSLENYILNRKIKGNFWNFKRIKLYKKNKVKWQDRKVHSRLIFDGNAGELKNPVLHYPYQNFRHWIRKYNYSTTLEVEEMLKKNISLRWYDILNIPAKAALVFYRLYIKGETYKNGLFGLFIFLDFVFVDPVVKIKYLIKKIRYSKNPTR